MTMNFAALPRLETDLFRKNCLWNSPLEMTRGTRATTQTDRWPWEPIISSIGDFESPTEIVLNGWQKAANLWPTSSLQMVAIFF